jgi:prolyl-tRNA editing enzyme YbaK/EbsC (Cys-tRNA(Pro) deacylase)
MKPASARKLDDLGLSYRLIRLRDRAVTVQDVVDNAEDDLDSTEICKTIIVKDRKGARYAVFLRGVDRIDFNRLRAVLGKVIIASREDVKEAWGVEPGAVCPLSLGIPVYLDVRVLELEKVNFGSGDHLYGIEVKTEDLDKALDYTVVDVAE